LVLVLVLEYSFEVLVLVLVLEYSSKHYLLEV